MEEKKILIKDIETNYKVFGQGLPAQTGRPMIVLHGWGSNSARWEKVAELLGEKNIQVFVPDLPGFGQTPEPKTAWDLNNYVEWVKEFSEKIPELNHGFFLLGHSFGGSLAVK